MMNKKTENDLKKYIKTLMKEKGFGKIPADKVAIGWPSYDEREILSALSALVELRISQGPRVKEFETQFAKYVGVKYAVAVNSGSSANLLALTAMMQAGKVKVGSEVIIPATTFATVASPILQLGLIPVYVDIDPKTWNIDPKALLRAIGPKTSVLMPVHTFGNPADMRTIMKIAKQRKLIVLEDCCEAHGARIKGRSVGSFADLATLSFFVAHNMTTGEGGMVFTNDKKYYEILLSLREFGRMSTLVNRFTYRDKVLGAYDTRYIFTRLGYNMRMTDIEAALGLVQLKKLDGLNKQRIKNVEIYRKAFKKYEKYLQMPHVEKGDFHSYYGFPMIIKKDAPFTRLELSQFLESRGVETRPFFGGSLPDQPAFRDEPKRIPEVLTNATFARDNGFFIGCHPNLSRGHIQIVLDGFADFFKKFGV